MGASGRKDNGLMSTLLKSPLDALNDYEGVVIFQPREGQTSEALYEQICRVYPAHRKIEQDSKGNVYLMPPTEGESGYQEALAVTQLTAWSIRKGKGKVFGPSTTFLFADGEKLQSDAAWISNERLEAIPYQKRRERIPVVPEFVIEIKSPSDVYKNLQEKMQQWLSQGVLLGWLIHPDHREVKIYTPTGVETRTDIDKLRGTGPVKGFTLDLRPIWQGLR